MSALICGSLAYDTIMVFPEPFRKHILPDQVHILNVAFTVPKMRREFGGVAGNISYNLKLLGGNPLPMATVGEDFGPYKAHLDALNISREYVKQVEGSFTAQAFITTDIEDNQITAFHPGAMQFSHQNKVADADAIGIGIVAPDGRDAMIQHSADFAAHGIPHIFDPGQAMTLFDGDDLKRFIEEANWIVVNDYEYQLLSERTGLDQASIASQVEALIITKGPEGSSLIVNGQETQIEISKADDVKDPTGCGDAYRAGLIYGIENDLDMVTCCQIGSVLGAIKIAHQGPQNHKPDEGEIRDRFNTAYGYQF